QTGPGFLSNSNAACWNRLLLLATRVGVWDFGWHVKICREFLYAGSGNGLVHDHWPRDRDGTGRIFEQPHHFIRRDFLIAVQLPVKIDGTLRFMDGVGIDRSRAAEFPDRVAFKCDNQDAESPLLSRSDLRQGTLAEQKRDVTCFATQRRAGEKKIVAMLIRKAFMA